MITFKGRQEILKPAKMLERKACSTYPHISNSRFTACYLKENAKTPKFLQEISKNISRTRFIFKNSYDCYSAVIYGLQDKKSGNCTEEAVFAQLLGLINGQKNIYAGGVIVSKDGNTPNFINHAVAFITNKPLKENTKYFFKNKDAVIIDPWLGITDFAGNYFLKLKTVFRNIFTDGNNKKFASFTNDKLIDELIREESKSPKEFNKIKKQYCPVTRLGVVPFIGESNNNNEIMLLKELFPELTIKGYKSVII